MLLTAELAIASGWTITVNCPRCTTIRTTSPRIVPVQLRRRPLRELWDEGKFVCQVHRVPATLLMVKCHRDNTTDELARFERKAPPSPAGPSQ